MPLQFDIAADNPLFSHCLKSFMHCEEKWGLYIKNVRTEAMQNMYSMQL